MKNLPTRSLVSAAVLLTVSACSSTGDQNNSTDALRQIEAKQSALDSRERLLVEREQALKTTRTRTAAQPTRVSTATQAMNADGQLLPPNAKAGQCFTRVWMEPKFKNSTQKTLISEASERIEVVPAKYSTVKKKIVVQEASTRLVSVPATYKTVSERILVSPSQTITETVPAVFVTRTERVLDKPAHTIWKKGTGPIQRIDSSTGEIMCLVEVPATYKTISRQELKTPATTRTRTVPAKYQSVTKKVVDTKAYTRSVEVPAKYSTVSVTEQVSPAKNRRVAIPAKYSQVSRRELASDGKMQWREIMCETNTTPAKIVQIQRALNAGGHNSGTPDGRYGPATIRAVTAFQKSKGLPADGTLTIDTVKALGVAPR